MPADAPVEPRPATPRRRGRGRLILGIAALVLVYVLVVVLYAFSGRVDVERATPGPDDTPVLLEPRTVDALGAQLEMMITPGADTGPLASGDALTLSGPMTLVVIPNNGVRQFEIPEGEILGPVTVRIPFGHGAIEYWPFDSYRVDAMILPARMVGDELEPLAPVYDVTGSVPGWAISMWAEEGADGPVVRIEAHRSIATVAFAIVLLALMTVMPVLVLTVAVSVYRGRRKVEATLMSWIGAMLFATIPLRNFFPGAPPIGSWVDYLVVLWVIAGLIVGLAIYAAAWMRWSATPDAAPRW